MKKNQHDQVVYRIAAETIEALALMFLVPDEEAPAGSDIDRITASACFTGPFSGQLVVSVSRAVLVELTGNMLGLDDGTPVPLEQQRDALKELANVICGNLLPEIGDVQQVFHIEPPIILDAMPEPQSDGGESLAGRACLTTDSGTAEVAIFIEQTQDVGVAG